MKKKCIALALALAAACLPAGASDLTEAAKTALPPRVTYRELPGTQSVQFMGRTIPYTAGQLIASFRKDGTYLAGYVISTEASGPEAALFAPYFRYGQTEKELAGLAAVNRSFFDEDAVLHKAVQDSVSRWADEMVGGAGAKLEVTLKDMEPVRRAGDVNFVMYTAGARIILSSEGLIMPLYGRGYMYKDGDGYRTVVLITSDDSRQPLTYALTDLVTEAARLAAERDLHAFVASIDLSHQK